MISGGYRCPLYDDDAAVTTTDLGSDQATHQLDSANTRASRRHMSCVALTPPQPGVTRNAEQTESIRVVTYSTEAAAPIPTIRDGGQPITVRQRLYATGGPLPLDKRR